MGVAVDARHEHERGRNMRGKRDRVMPAYRFRSHAGQLACCSSALDQGDAAFGEGHGRPHFGARDLDRGARLLLDTGEGCGKLARRSSGNLF